MCIFFRESVFSIFFCLFCPLLLFYLRYTTPPYCRRRTGEEGRELSRQCLSQFFFSPSSFFLPLKGTGELSLLESNLFLSPIRRSPLPIFESRGFFLEKKQSKYENWLVKQTVCSSSVSIFRVWQFVLTFDIFSAEAQNTRQDIFLRFPALDGERSKQPEEKRERAPLLPPTPP